jgi:hypothetical protein
MSLIVKVLQRNVARLIIPDPRFAVIRIGSVASLADCCAGQPPRRDGKSATIKSQIKPAVAPPLISCDKHGLLTRSHVRERFMFWVLVACVFVVVLLPIALMGDWRIHD